MQGGSVRATITLSKPIYRKIKKFMKMNGYNNNFSAFIQDAAIEKQARLERLFGKNNGK